MDIWGNELIQVLSNRNEPESHILRELVRDPTTLNNISLVFEALYSAVSKGFLNSVRILLEAGVSPNIRSLYSEESALHIACEKQHTTIILELLKYGVDVNAEDLDKRTALHRASFNKNIGNMQILLQNGAKVNAVDKDGRTPLYIGIDGPVDVSHSQDELSAVSAVVQVLLSAGADINVSDVHGMTILHFAVNYHLPHVVPLLLQYKADANARDTNGNTPLHCAAMDMDGPCESIRGLLKGGARLDSLNNEGHSPLRCAVHARNVEATQELLRRGASFDIAACLGPLVIAASKRQSLDDITAIAQELIRYNFIKNPHSLKSTRHQQLRRENISNILCNMTSPECNLGEFQQACFSEVKMLSKLSCDCGKSSIWGSINNWEECECDSHQAILKFLFSGRHTNFGDAFFYNLSKDFLLEVSLNLLSYFAFKESQKRLILPWPCMKEIKRYVSFEDAVSFLRCKQSEMGVSEFENYLAFMKGETSVKSSTEISPPASKKIRLS